MKNKGHNPILLSKIRFKVSPSCGSIVTSSFSLYSISSSGLYIDIEKTSFRRNSPTPLVTEAYCFSIHFFSVVDFVDVVMVFDVSNSL